MPIDYNKIRQTYGNFFDAVAAILFEKDPISINFGVNTDEYEPEAATIIGRLDECTNSEDVCCIVHEEFVKWFGADIAGVQANYTDIAVQIWHLWENTSKFSIFD